MTKNDDLEYGIERTKDGKVSIMLGTTYFQVPPETALKMACLLLKYAGCAIRLLSGSIIATYSKKSLKDGPQDHKDYDPMRYLN